ncbi:MAG: hypothetical protein J0I75_20995, partial [Hyphomicrobium sp.]|nr:hypothetical protein [Hyphomicrobium sp.]
MREPVVAAIHPPAPERPATRRRAAAWATKRLLCHGAPRLCSCASLSSIYGSNDPNADGSWDSWTFLRTCEAIKPSGSPAGTNTA